MATPSFQEINSHLEGKKKLSLNSILEFLSKPLEYKREEEKQPEKYKIRDVDIDRKSFDEVFRPVVFGEVSNRPLDKKELESRVIFNTVLNRMKEKGSRGVSSSLEDVLAEKNQYQAYGGEQFNLYQSKDLDEPTKQKKQEVDSILDNLWNEVKSGTLEDNTEGAYYYIHNKDGTISYDNKRELFAKN